MAFQKTSDPVSYNLVTIGTNGLIDSNSLVTPKEENPICHHWVPLFFGDLWGNWSCYGWILTIPPRTQMSKPSPYWCYWEVVGFNGRKGGHWGISSKEAVELWSLPLCPTFLLPQGQQFPPSCISLCHRIKAQEPSDSRLKPSKLWSKLNIF